MKRLIMYALLSAITFILMGCNNDGDTPTAQVRVVHASPDAPNVDVLVNDKIELADVPYKGVSSYLSQRDRNLHHRHRCNPRFARRESVHAACSWRIIWSWY